MKLVHPLFGEPIRFGENSIQVLTVENPVMFRTLVFELTEQAESKEGRFVLSVNDRLLDCAGHLQVVGDYAHLSAPDKRLQTKLFTALLRHAQETMAEETFRLSAQLQEYLGKLAALADYPVAYEQSENLLPLLKAMEFRVDLEDLPPHETLYEYLSLLDRLLKDQCFVLVQAKTYFSEQELLQLYSMAQYRKWNLLLLEAHAAPRRLEGEVHRLYDADLCELLDP